MFTDKTRPPNGQQLSTVSTVSRFYDAPGVKKCDTVETVDSSAQFNARLNRPQIHGYILCMETATGTWYFSGFYGDMTRLAWSQDIDRIKVAPGQERHERYAAEKQAEITDLFGAGAIIGKITAKPVSIVNHRNILIEEEEQ